MKIIKVLTLVMTVGLLASCGTNNNPVVEERPFEDVTIDEANTFFNDVIFEEENIRQFFKNKILLDFSELDQINQDTFEMSEISLVDEAKNEFQITFYHHYSNYNLTLKVYLDKEDDQLLVYNVQVAESTYDYMTDDFLQMHINNVMNYLENNELNESERCARFDVTNELCEGLTQVIDSLDYKIVVNNIQDHDTYYIVAFNLESTDTILHFSTEIEIGINDEGSFVYDLSFLHQFNYEPNNTELFDIYETRMMRMINDLNKGAITYTDACDMYFYGEHDCLEGLSTYEIGKDNQMVYRYFLLDDSFYKLYVDYNPSHSFDKDEILYRIYTTDNGNIFMHQVSSKSQENDAFIETYYENLLLGMLDHINEPDFCTYYDPYFPNCELLKVELNELNMDIAIDQIIKTDNTLQVLFNFKDPLLNDFYHYEVGYEISSVIDGYGDLSSIMFSRYKHYFGVENAEKILKQYLSALGDASMSTEDLLSRYRMTSEFTESYTPSLREIFSNIDVSVLTENWTYTQDTFKSEIIVTPYTEDNELLYLSPLKMTIYEVEDGTYYMDFVDGFPEIYTPETHELSANTLASRLTDLTISDEEACAFDLTTTSGIESNCMLFREILASPELSYFVHIPDFTSFPLRNQVTFLFYNTLSGKVTDSFTLDYAHNYIFVNTPATVTVMRYTNFSSDFAQINYWPIVNYFYANYQKFEVSDEEACQNVSNYDYCITLRNRLFTEEISIDQNLYILNSQENQSEFLIGYALSEPLGNIQQFQIYTESKIVDGELVVMLRIFEFDEEVT